jgi:hypothetical protein
MGVRLKDRDVIEVVMGSSVIVITLPESLITVSTERLEVGDIV